MTSNVKLPEGLVRTETKQYIDIIKLIDTFAKDAALEIVTSDGGRPTQFTKDDLVRAMKAFFKADSSKAPKASKDTSYNPVDINNDGRALKKKISEVEEFLEKKNPSDAETSLKEILESLEPKNLTDSESPKSNYKRLKGLVSKHTWASSVKAKLEKLLQDSKGK